MITRFQRRNPAITLRLLVCPGFHRQLLSLARFQATPVRSEKQDGRKRESPCSLHPLAVEVRHTFPQHNSLALEGFAMSQPQVRRSAACITILIFVAVL